MKWESVIGKPQIRTIENMNNSIITSWMSDYAQSIINEKKKRITIKQYMNNIYDFMLEYKNDIHNEDDIELVKVKILRIREKTTERKEYVMINTMTRFVNHVLRKQGKPMILKERRRTVTEKSVSYKVNSEITIRFYKERNIQNSTINGYESAFKHYLISQKENNLDKLLQEAQLEQHNKVPLPETKLKKRLIQYRQYLIDKQMSSNTINSHFCKVKSFYKHMDCLIPPIKEVKLEKPYVSNYKDLPSKEELIKAVEIANPIMKALMIFQLSSGQARAEALSITVGQFLQGCTGYMDDNLSIQDQVKQLYARDDVVPIFYLRRLKTDKWYYTCCSPEAVKYICSYLIQRTLYSCDDPLFDIGPSSVIVGYNKLNDKLRLGFVGKYRKLRSHAMRKYHASKLKLSPEQVDMLQGRSRNVVHEAYIKINPTDVKEMYMRVMSDVMLWPTRWCKNESEKTESPETVTPVSSSTTTPTDNQSFFELYRHIGKLEARIEMLEEKIMEAK